MTNEQTAAYNTGNSDFWLGKPLEDNPHGFAELAYWWKLGWEDGLDDQEQSDMDEAYVERIRVENEWAETPQPRTVMS